MRVVSMLIIAFLFHKIIAHISLKNNRLSDNFSLVSSASIDIITCCYSKYVQNAVLSGVTDNKIIESIWQSNKSISVIQTNKNFLCSKLQLNKHLTLFLVMVSNRHDLGDYFTGIKKCPLWNIHQTFLIVDKFTNENDCQDAFELLQISWGHNLLHSYYLCYQYGQVLIWTFNPFANIAPDPWLHHNLDKKSSNNWTLYYQEYHNDPNINICENFQWDKTMQLNGFEIIVGGIISNGGENISSDHVSEECRTVYDTSYLPIILFHLNVSENLQCVTAKELGVVNKVTGEATGLFGALAAGNYDILWNPFLGRYIRNITVAQRNAMARMLFIVLPKGNISAIEKILRYLGIKLIVATIIIILITLIALRLFTKNPIIPLFLEVIRLLIATKILKFPTSNAAKLFFGPTFIFFLLFQGIFQSRLSALLTISIPKENLDTVEDLKTHTDHKIYAPAIQSYLLDEELQTRLIVVSDDNCIKYVDNDTMAVCIGSEAVLCSVEQKKFHFSSDSLYTTSVYFFMRNDWPIQQEFEKVLMRMIEAGLTYHLENKNGHVNEEVQSLDHLIEEASFSPLKLKELMFIFQGLIIGLFLATTIFFLEIRG